MEEKDPFLNEIWRSEAKESRSPEMQSIIDQLRTGSPRLAEALAILDENQALEVGEGLNGIGQDLRRLLTLVKYDPEVVEVILPLLDTLSKTQDRDTQIQLGKQIAKEIEKER